MRVPLKSAGAAGVLGIAGLVFGCGGGTQTGDPAPSRRGNAPGVSKAAAQYYCEMHPDVVSSEPGKCPRCQMALKRR